MHPPAPAIGPGKDDTPGTPRRRKWLDGLIVAFATFHALRLLAGIIPEVKRPELLPGLGTAYEKLTGTQQHWNMFETIPSLHAFNTRVIILSQDGKPRRLGPLLPGLREYPAQGDSRLFLLFSRMIDDSMNAGLFESYLRSMNQTLHAEGKIRPGESWRLEVDEDYTRLLTNIEKDGQVFQRKTRQFGLPAASSAPAAP